MAAQLPSKPDLKPLLRLMNQASLFNVSLPLVLAHRSNRVNQGWNPYSYWVNFGRPPCRMKSLQALAS